MIIYVAFLTGLITFLLHQLHKQKKQELQLKAKAYHSEQLYRDLVYTHHQLVNTYHYEKRISSVSGRDPKLKERAIKLMNLSFSKANTNEAKVAQGKLKELITKEL